MSAYALVVGSRPPSGTVTFLFTDIEGSTRRWETAPEVMRAALALHDEVLRLAVEGREGWLFKHTGDGVCAAFGSARAAIDAAVEAQRALGLPVRMGVATGEAERRGDDHFGPVLNRTARVMTAGHGGQILVASSTAAVVSGVDLMDRGEHRLRDLSGVERLYQVRAEGLGVEFAPLRTMDAVAGNLPLQATSLVGREAAVTEVADLVRAHRLVTLTGVGGVGKTRLAIQVAAALAGEFRDGVWVVELAPVGDGAAVPDALAAVLGVTRQAGMSVTESVTQALSGRRLLLVLDNCEHVLTAAADVVEQLLVRTSTVQMIATSREALGVAAERRWPVPSLDVTGAGSAAVALFVERAQAVNPSFGLGDDADAAAVIEICHRLDGLALAIELAAARMVSMGPEEVRDRLGDRFRLLAGSRRGLDRHQTLGHAVAWSYELLDDGERTVLQRCSVFGAGFDLPAATAISAQADEYAVLDTLDSLVRKSLVSVEQVDHHTRYGMLETIRQYAQDQLAASGTINDARDHHARYFADQATAHWMIWDGPRQRVALDWVDLESANLRLAFRWAADQGDLDTAATIAAHAAMLGWALQRFESAEWAEEVLASANASEVRRLPRLYTAASLCAFTGRPEQALGYAQTARTLELDPRYDPFDSALNSLMEATAHRYAGRFERWLEISAELTDQPGNGHIIGLWALTFMLAELRRADEARALADEAVEAARTHGNPMWISLALWGYGRAFTETDPTRARMALREALDYAQDHRLPMLEANIARHAASLEAAHGQLDDALVLFDTALDSFDRSGNHGDLSTTLAYLTVCFDRIGRPEIAATLCGTSTTSTKRHAVQDRLRGSLGQHAFDECFAAGAAMQPADAVAYARHHIDITRSELADEI